MFSYVWGTTAVTKFLNIKKSLSGSECVDVPVNVQSWSGYFLLQIGLLQTYSGDEKDGNI